ncbi:DgyrCDS5008 [Dimorphilus gyrociliatus]|uniref:DgyrCDS5008 n=1 Tax=Dimorphilus gyrociliatus TaxID=2664684 RepID=A0A7I8VK37_9ANNE|nr:DgyrCDS5008 [Dimorphilus gyrociliatus]
MKIECGEGYTIKILNAYYGRETTLVRSDFCSAGASSIRRNICEQDVNDNTLNSNLAYSTWNPQECPTSLKRFLMVDYTCQRISLKQACDGDWMLLECPRDYTIIPVGVFYGRSLAEKCLPPDRDNYEEYEYGIKKKDNISYCRFNTRAVYSAIRLKCLNRRLCSFKVDKEIFSGFDGMHKEKCPEDVKTYLKVHYLCEDSVKQTTSYICSNEVFEPSCPRGQLINIKSTLRGRLQLNDSKCEKDILSTFKGPCQVDIVDGMQKMIKRCQLKNSCKVPNTIDEWNGLNFTYRRCTEEDKPYLVTLYECQPKSSLIICPKQGPKTVECPRGYVIEPSATFFGRHNDLSCLDENETIDIDRVCYSDSNEVLRKVNSLCRGRQTCTLIADSKYYMDGDKFSKSQCSGPFENKQYLWINYRCTYEQCLTAADKAEKELSDCLKVYENLCLTYKFQQCYTNSLNLLSKNKECKEFKRRFKSYYSWWIPAHKKLLCQLPSCAFQLAREFSEIFKQYNKIPDKVEPGKLHYLKCAIAEDIEQQINENIEFDFQYHFIMLSCISKMRNFYNGIKNGDGLKGKVVADVGSGTGILAMWCAQAGAKRVYAIEPNDNYNLLVENVKRNKLEDVIQAFHSTAEEVELPEKVDVIVSEVLGTALIGDAIFPFLVQARDKFLKPDGVMLPSHATLNIAPIADNEFITRGEELLNNFHSLYDLDLGNLADYFRKSCAKKVYCKLIRPETVKAKPAVVDRIDFKTLKFENSTTCSGRFEFVMNRSTDIQGFAIWFTATFPNGISFSTGPTDHPTHWRQDVLYLEKNLQVQKGDVIEGFLKVENDMSSKFFYSTKLEFTVNGKDKQVKDCYIGLDRGQLLCGGLNTLAL